MTVKNKMLLRHVGRRKYIVTRISDGFRDPSTGRWVDGTESTFEVTGHEQPSGPQEIQMLPDSFRSKDVRLFMTTSDLRTIEEGTQDKPDKITIDGVKFVVHKKKSYQMGPRQHYELIVVREEQSAGGTS